MKKMKKISQREARRLQRRVAELERVRQRELATYGREYPGGVHIATLTVSQVERAKLHTAQILSHPLVCTVQPSFPELCIAVYALPVPSQ